MRLLFIFIAILFSVIVLGLTPRPLVKPNWQTQYEAAIDKNDCSKIERTIDILFIAGLETEGHKEALSNYKNQRCKYARLTEREVEIAEYLSQDGSGWAGSLELNTDLWSSVIGRKIRLLRRVKYPASPFIRKHERLLHKKYMDSCFKLATPGMGGVPNYELLELAIGNSGMSVERIAAIARSERRACANMIVRDSQTIAAASTNPEEFAVILRYLWVAEVFSHENPELGPKIAQLKSSIPKAAYEIANFFEEQDAVTLVSVFTCHAWYSDRILEDAIECAVSAESAIGTKDYADIQAVYYARRSVRLGWQDVSRIEANASKYLSDECLNAITELESKEAEGVSESKDFRNLRWPIYQGDACAV